MKKLLAVILVIISLASFSQIKYEPGYYINNADEITSCLIKNVDWQKNPTEFLYKLDKNSEPQTGGIKDIKEFGVLNFSRYKRYTVKVDTSSENISNLSSNREPEFDQQVVFLKTLVSGKGNLYVLDKRNFLRFFYSKNDSVVEQLIYKTYKVSDNSSTKNNTYKEQLLHNFSCENISMNDLEALTYSERELVKYFTAYNNCQGSTTTRYDKTAGRSMAHFNLRPGVILGNLSLHNDLADPQNTHFQNKIGFRIGVEAETFLPFNKNKWSIMTEPNFQYLKSSIMQDGKAAALDYKAIEFPIGVRHYSFLSDDSKIFINGCAIINLPLNSQVSPADRPALKISQSLVFAAGVGYAYKNRCSFELRYEFSNKLLNKYVSWSSSYRSASIIFGYNLKR